MSLLNPRIRRHLIADHGEVVIDEVRKHWAALIVPWLEAVAGGGILLWSSSLRAEIAWLPALVGIAGVSHGAWRIIGVYRDRFVITNMRVFRVHGILSQQIATMPLARILDVSVYKPFEGRLLNYGHFVFESAAQAQGLREIRFVGRPDKRGLTIQRVITQAGLRGFAGRDAEMAAGASRQRTGTGTQPQPTVPPVPPVPARVEADHRELAWLAGALRREHARLAELRGEKPPEPEPDSTDTAPITLPR